MHRRFTVPTLIAFLVAISSTSRLGCCPVAASSRDPHDGRYSFSLTTFDPEGRLGQVRRALQAAALGPPVVVLARADGAVIMASPQVLPSPFMEDDGTMRFSRVSDEILVAHSGISADGRVLVAQAQRLAVQHEYTFDESIPMELFLEGMSLYYQEFTMKPAARPFGATLIVAHVPCGGASATKRRRPQLYQIDPSGSVSSLGSHAIVHGNLERGQLPTVLRKLSGQPELLSSSSSSDSTDTVDTTTSIEEDQQRLVEALASALAEQAARNQPGQQPEKTADPNNDDLTILTASLSHRGVLTRQRHKAPFVTRKKND